MSQLLKETKQMLKGETGRFPEIVKEAGGEFSYDWLHQVNQNRIKQPSIQKIEALHKILCARKKKALKA